MFDAAVILSYTAMFHAARALLFLDGIIEKSHICLAEYLRAEYVRKGKLRAALVNDLDSLRIDRHETMYGPETKCGAKEAEYALRKAKEFLEALRETRGKARHVNVKPQEDVDNRSITEALQTGHPKH